MDRGAGVLDASAIRAFHDRLDSPIAVSAELDDGEHVLGELRCLDELRNTISAREARLAVAAHEAQRGRKTSERNGEGLCDRCNYVTEHPDVQVTGDASHTTFTVGGFTATSRPRSPPGLPPPTSSYPERTLMDIVWRSDLRQRDDEKKRG